MMKQGNGKVWMIAATVCMVSLVVLLGGMGAMAVQQGNGREVYGAEGTGESEAAADVIGDVLDEVQTEAAQEAEDLSWLDGVPIVTWDGYYAMSVPPKDYIAEDGTVREYTEEERQNRQNPNIEGDGIGGELLENELSMEEAGVLALKEIRRVFNEDMEGLIMIMRLVDAPDGQGHIWYGYAANFVNGQEGFNENDMKGYDVYLDPLTGEILSLQNSRAGTEEDYALGQMQQDLRAQLVELKAALSDGSVTVSPPAEDGSVTVSPPTEDDALQAEELEQLYRALQMKLEAIKARNVELVVQADAYVEAFGLADLSEYHGTYAAEDEFYWRDQEAKALILYSRGDDAPELGVYVCRSSGRLYKYEYYDRMEYPWVDAPANGIEQAQ